LLTGQRSFWSATHENSRIFVIFEGFALK